MNARKSLFFAAFFIFLGAPGCSSAVPTPPLGEHGEGDASVEVPYPPPPAQVEILPDPPDDGVARIWVDGEWTWRARRWTWTSGHWVLPQPGAVYAPPQTIRLNDGTLMHRPGGFRLAP